MSAKLDIITLRGLTADGIHGVFEFEHAATQPFVIDIALWVDTTDAITSDDIADTVSYADVANSVVAVVEGPSAHLIETLAQRISDVLLANPRVEGVEVTVHKPKAPMEQEFSDVAITVRRGNTPGTILRIRDITVVDGKVAPEADEPLVSFGGPDEASVFPSPAPTSSISLQGVNVPTQPTRFTSVANQSAQCATRAPERRRAAKHEVLHPFVLALGGNVGDVPVTLADAVSQLIDIPEVRIDDVSPLLRTHAVLAPGQAPQQDHWNAVVIGHTSLSPHDFYTHTCTIETALGRVRHEHWGPRRIDIDIIAMGDLRIDDAVLTIPHPRAHLRAFVLAPWALTDPDAVLPGHGRIEELLNAAEDINGIVDAVDDWLESPEGIQAESDVLVGSQAFGGGNTASQGSASPASGTQAPSTQSSAPTPVSALESDLPEWELARDRLSRDETSSPEPIRAMTDLSRPLVIPPIAVPELTQPLPMSRLDRLDPTSKASLQPDQGADLLWHKVWNSWAQTPIDPEELTDADQAHEVAAQPTEVKPAAPAPVASAPVASAPVEAAPPIIPPASRRAARPVETVAPASAPAAPPAAPSSFASSPEVAPRLNFVVSPDKPLADTPPAAQESAEELAEGLAWHPTSSGASTAAPSTGSQPAISQPLPFQQVLVDDVVLEENPGQRQMRWAPVQSYEGSSVSQEGQSSGQFGSRTVAHSDVPLSASVGDEAEARAELERIEAAQADRVQREKELQELRARERREQEARAAALVQEEAIRAEAARLEAARKAAAARVAAEREASMPPLPKRRAQFAPLRADAPRVGGVAAERPLPQWDFSGSRVTIVDDSDHAAAAAAAAAAHASVLAPDLPEGTPTGAVGEAPGQTGMLSRVTMRPTATGMIPVVKRDSLHS